MQDSLLQETVCRLTGADEVLGQSSVQSLWSGYGQIVRMKLRYGERLQSVVVKSVCPPDASVANARGWSGQWAHDRKLRSYVVERNWYRDWSDRCGEACRVPDCLGLESTHGQSVFVLEDLDAAGFDQRRGHLDEMSLSACLSWLAAFHRTFLGCEPDGLWPKGTYWHLDTRPEELAAMEEGPLKQAAPEIDRVLSGCRFKTLVHGDAKVANFCFSSSGNGVAAVDFQYVGGGCGIRDVAYFLGSCLSESECERREEECLDVYFAELTRGMEPATASELESEWRSLFGFAWADFHRFLCGWCATHPKLTRYSRQSVDRVLRELQSD